MELSRCPNLATFGTAFILLSINLNIHGETVYQSVELRTSLEAHIASVTLRSSDMLINPVGIMVAFALTTRTCQGFRV